MSTITRERLLIIQQWRETYGPGSNVVLPAEEAEELARIALASLEAEAVGTFRKGPCGYSPSFHEDAVPLYSAPPAPVSVPDYPETLPCPVMLEPGLRFGKGVTTKTMLGALQRRAEHYAELEAMTPEQRAEHDAGMKELAAMLQGTDGKPELTVWYGSMPESNGKANWTAILHRKGESRCMDGFTIDRSEYPGRVLYAADRVRYLIGEKSERPSILDYDADAHSGYVKPGNSPVIPDGWVMVPVEPTEDMIVNGFESEPDESFSDAEVWEAYDAMSGCQQAAHRAKLCWAAMIAAAPKLEA
ncbi:hypothetical protein ACOY9E_21185 [Enterobacter asburiae]|uniref:hypothetical protein n=1 Tax=Enterobacter asburiae TaxID=61645 RepID=UPI003BEEB959